ncbi:MAG: hypothetical protein HY597_02235 [Candidatus Omnitrophica bacterium]|nr:hypothetical protein [Candidatus Omnitrophota bacterium]
MKLRRLLVLAVLLAAIAFAAYGVVQYVALLRERNVLTARLAETQQSLVLSERAKAQVEGELVTTQNSLQAALAEKVTLTDRVGFLEDKADRLAKSAAQAAKTLEGLRQTKAALQAQVTDLTTQRAALDARLHNIDELQAALREAKQHLKLQGPPRVVPTMPPAAPRPRPAAARPKPATPSPRGTLEGNRGYVIEDGVPTIGPARFRVRVVPAPADPVAPPTASQETVSSAVPASP